MVLIYIKKRMTRTLNRAIFTFCFHPFSLFCEKSLLKGCQHASALRQNVRKPTEAISIQQYTSVKQKTFYTRCKHRTRCTASSRFAYQMLQCRTFAWDGVGVWCPCELCFASSNHKALINIITVYHHTKKVWLGR